MNPHHEKGVGIALEGMKLFVVINGAAVGALLTFAGNLEPGQKPALLQFGDAMIAFSFGVIAAALMFASAYLAQLYYGNGNENVAWRWHGATYVLLGASTAAFVVGAWLARLGLIAL